MQIEIGRLLVMKAAWKLDQGDCARKEVSMAKVHVADTLHQAADTAIQLNGARGYSKDTVAGMDLPLRPPGAAGRRRRRGAPDGAGPLHARGRPRLLALERGQPDLTPHTGDVFTKLYKAEKRGKREPANCRAVATPPRDRMRDRNRRRAR